ncbi:MAG TPA: DUF4112 domain-containing protein [Caulobacteraceae bacterium]
MRDHNTELLAIRRSVELVGKLTDGLLRIGPFRLGAEAALSWIPIVGEGYGGAVALFLLAQGARAKVPLRVLASCAAMMFGRTLITAVPIAGPLAADALALHGLSARMIIAAIDKRLARLEAKDGAAPDGRPWGWRGGPAQA